MIKSKINTNVPVHICNNSQESFKIAKIYIFLVKLKKKGDRYANVLSLPTLLSGPEWIIRKSS